MSLSWECSSAPVKLPVLFAPVLRLSMRKMPVEVTLPRLAVEVDPAVPPLSMLSYQNTHGKPAVQLGNGIRP